METSGGDGPTGADDPMGGDDSSGDDHMTKEDAALLQDRLRSMTVEEGDNFQRWRRPPRNVLGGKKMKTIKLKTIKSKVLLFFENYIL